jgi:hypothetical protein
VIDDAGRGVADAEVSAGSKNAAWAFPVESIATRSGAEGRYALTGLPAGSAWVAAVAEGGGWANRENVAIELGAVTGGVDLMLQPTSATLTLRGRVISVQNGVERPEPGTEITVYFEPPVKEGGGERNGAMEEALGWRGERTTVSDEEGNFELSGLPSPSRCRPTPAKQLREAEPTELVVLPDAALATETLTLRLKPEGSLRMRVNDPNGSSVAGARVALAMRYATAGGGTGQRFDEGYDWARRAPAPAIGDEAGRSRFDGLDLATKYGVRVEADGFPSLESEALEADPAIEHALTMKRGGTLRGRVVLEGSNIPVSGMNMAAYRGGGVDQDARTTVTDLGGEFQFSMLPAGSYAVGGRRAGGGVEASIALPANSVTVRPDETTTVRLEAFAPMTVRGTVRSGGEPLRIRK